MRTKKIFLTEEKLVKALQAQDQVAIHALYDMYSPALLGLITSIVRRPEVAEDLLQDVFIKIWHSGVNYDPDKGRLFTWMINLARNYAIDTLRSKGFKNSGKNDDIDDCLKQAESRSKSQISVDTIGLRSHVWDLKPEYSELLSITFFSGYTHVEAAKLFNLPLGTVKTRIRKALQQLRTLYLVNEYY